MDGKIGRLGLIVSFPSGDGISLGGLTVIQPGLGVYWFLVTLARNVANVYVL